MAIIKPYDASTLPAIEKAIRDSDLGVNPTSDGSIIRVVFPQLTEDRRRDLIKVAKTKAEANSDKAKAKIKTDKTKAENQADVDKAAAKQ